MNKPLIARVLLANAAAFCLLGLLLKLLGVRSEEHTSELQSQSNLVCRLLLEKKTLAKRLRGRETNLNIRRVLRAARRHSLIYIDRFLRRQPSYRWPANLYGIRRPETFIRAS